MPSDVAVREVREYSFELLCGVPLECSCFELLLPTLSI